jgi:hypothetical protein
MKTVQALNVFNTTIQSMRGAFSSFRTQGIGQTYTQFKSFVNTFKSTKFNPIQGLSFRGLMGPQGNAQRAVQVMNQRGLSFGSGGQIGTTSANPNYGGSLGSRIRRFAGNLGMEGNFQGEGLSGMYGRGAGLRRAANVIGPAATGSLGIAASFATAPLQLMGKALGGIGNFAGKLMGIKPESMQKIGMAMKNIGGGMQQMGMMAVLDVVMQLLSALNPLKPLLDALTTIFSVYGEILSTAFTPLIEKLFAVMLSEEVMGLVQQLADQFLILVTMLLPVVDILAPLGAVIFPMIGAVLQSLQPIILLFVGVLATLVPIITQLLNLFLSLWNLLAPILIPIIGTIVMLFSSIAVILGGVLTMAITAVLAVINALSGGWDAFKNTLQSGWDMIVAGFKGLINGFIDILNIVPNAINQLDVAGVVPDIGTIPHLAAGGIINRPTMALIGEAGPEAVVPLNKSNTNIGGGTTIVINGDVTEEHLFKMQRDIWLRSLI